MQQITSLKKEIMDLEVYKELLFTKNNLTIHVKLAIFIDSQGEFLGETKPPPSVTTTPTKGRVLFDSLDSISDSSKKHQNRSAYYGTKSNHFPKAMRGIS